jgi:hypothetical protein
MISTEIQPSDASKFHIQPSTAQQLLEDVHIEASSTQNPPSNSNTLSNGNADNQEPLSTFTLFPLLPTELRLRIWRLATFTRVVSFIPGGGKAPSVLSACRESRTESRKLYRLCIRASSPILRDPDPPFKIVPEYGFFINYEVDILHVSPLFGFQKMREMNHAGIGILLGHKKALMILNSRFPLWHLPTKKILFELPGPQAPADWSHRTSETYSSPSAMAWGSLFGRTAILCPLLEEIMFLRSGELEGNQPVHMVSATNASNAAFLDAENAFTEAEKAYRKKTNFFSGVRTEKEASERIMEAPKAPEGNIGRFSKSGWWDNNPKLTLVEVGEQ